MYIVEDCNECLEEDKFLDLSDLKCLDKYGFKYICGFCFAIMTHPVVVNLPCHHVFGKNCLDRWLIINDVCPGGCNYKFTKKPYYYTNYEIKKIVFGQKIRCNNAKQGCLWQGKVDKYSVHNQSCTLSKTKEHYFSPPNITMFLEWHSNSVFSLNESFVSSDYSIKYDNLSLCFNMIIFPIGYGEVPGDICIFINSKSSDIYPFNLSLKFSCFNQKKMIFNSEYSKLLTYHHVNENWGINIKDISICNLTSNGVYNIRIIVEMKLILTY